MFLMFINPTRLFHGFQHVEWFVQRWMICKCDVECILTMLSDLHTICDTWNALYFVEWYDYVEWFMLTWIICTYNVECSYKNENKNIHAILKNVECILTTLKDLHCCRMIWMVQWNFFLENIPRKIARLPRNFLSHENPHNEHCHIVP